MQGGAGFVRGGLLEDWREGGKAQVSHVTLNKSLNLSGPLALCLAMPAAPSHPSDLGSYVTSSERPSLTLNNQFGLGGISTLSMIKCLSGLFSD